MTLKTGSNASDKEEQIELTYSITHTPVSQGSFEDFDYKDHHNFEEPKHHLEPIVVSAASAAAAADDDIVVDIDDNEQMGSQNKNPFIFFRRKDIPLLALAITCNALSAGTHVATTILIEKLFNKLTKFQNGHYPNADAFIKDLRWACFSIALVGFGGWIFGWMETTFFSYLGERQQIRCRRMLYRSLLNRNYTWFESKRGLDGDLIQLNRSAEEFRTAISEYFSMLCGSIFLVFAMSITSFIYSWRLTLLILATFPIMCFVVFVFGKPVERWAQLEDQLTAETISHIDWNLLSFIWVKIVHSKDLELSKMKPLLDSCEKAYQSFSLYSQIIAGSLSTLALMMFVQSFWFGSWLIKRKFNTPGEVMAAFYSCLSVSITVASLSALTVVFQKAAASFGKIMRFMSDSELAHGDDDNYKISKNGETLPFDLAGNISFQNVVFSYSNRNKEQVLKNVSFTIPKYKTTFIIGKSGSGKSTISSLLVKLYTPKRGKIVIDEYDLNYLDDSYLREQITLVQQFPTLFNESLRSNLVLGTSFKDSDTQSLLDAMTIFNLTELLETLPNGLNTFLGAGENSCVQLSGGQEQRVNLARARLRDTPILILDESLSAIDIQQRSTLMDRIKEWRRGKTTIIITHEFLGMDDDDDVLVINNGEIIQTGVKRNLTIFDNLDSSSDEFVSLDSSDEFLSHFKYFDFQDGNDDVKEKVDEVPQGNANDLEIQSIFKKDDDLKSIRVPIFVAYKLVMNLMPFKFKCIYLLGLVLSVGNAITNPVFSFFISKLINGIVPISMGGYLSSAEQVKWSMAATSMAIAQGLLIFSGGIALKLSSQRFCKILSLTVFKKILNQNMNYFENVQANEISTLIMNDMRDFRNVVSGTLSHIMCGIAIFICCIAWTLTIGWSYALVGFSMFPLFGFFSMAGTLLMQRFEFQYKDKLNNLEELIHNTRVGIKTILCLNLKTRFLDNFETRLQSVLHLGFLRAIAMGCVINCAAFVSSLCQAILYYYGLTLVAKGKYSLVDMTQIVMMITMSTAYIARIMSSAPGIYRGLRVAMKLNMILELPDDDNETTGSLLPDLSIKHSKSTIEFKNVSFAYPSAPNNLVLKSINMNIPPNTIFSLVGESGCGKSTIASLLLRLYQIKDNEGEIELDGCDINEINLAHLRNNISVVSQKHFFFDGTFRENLLYNHPRPETINEDKVNDILEKLDLFDLTQGLPNGLDSKLSVSGQLLVSGGQIQRLSIARALLRPFNVLILDECTSSLDLQSSSRVMDVLDTLKEEKTIICITHKKDIMVRSDILCYLKDGEIVEEGNYQTLISNKSHFFQMINKIV